MYFPIILSFKVASLSLLFVAPVGIALAWLQARREYPLHTLVDAAILLPLVLPPSVVGYLLIVLLGRNGLIGEWLLQLAGIRIIFSPAAAVIASAIVALPILVKTAQPAIEAVPDELEQVGSSLGLPPLSLFFRVTLRSAWKGITAALVLAFARAMGEFGATLMFAGNIPGSTNTMPLEIFTAYRAGEDARALAYVLVLTAFSCLVVFMASVLSPRDGRRAG